MTEELAYALITPYSLYKSRTGGILGRLLAQSKLELAAVRMFIFSEEFIDEYTKIICSDETDEVTRQAWGNYLNRNLRKSNSWHYAPRCMLLLLRGPNAVRKLKDEVIGSFTETPVGNTIRGTFGDYIRDEDGSLHHFEPAVITATNSDKNQQHLELLSRFSATDGGLLTDKIRYDDPHNIQTTLVLLKTGQFNSYTRQAGNIVDTISYTGLKIVGARLLRMSVATAEKLYGPMIHGFSNELRPSLTQNIYARLHDAFSFPLTMSDAEGIADRLCHRNASAEFARIVHYMTGIDPEELSDDQEMNSPGRVRTLALLYQGSNAIEKVQTALAGADPTKAMLCPDRSAFAMDLQRNGAHASQSEENADRQRHILEMSDTQADLNNFSRIIEKYISK